MNPELYISHFRQFAIVAGNQGILLCTLNGGLGGIVVLCAETLITLKGKWARSFSSWLEKCCVIDLQIWTWSKGPHFSAWTGIHQAVIGDFQLIGHDQVLLLALSSQVEKSSTSDVSYLRPMHLTDMKNDFFSNLKQHSQLDASGAWCLICLPFASMQNMMKFNYYVART